MLREELAGRTVNKAEHNRQIQKLLAGRTRSSVELKHQNISAVLIGMGLPYIDGYKPMGKYQALLKTGVEDFLTAHTGYLGQFERSPVLQPTEPKQPPRSLKQIIEAPPEPVDAPKKRAPWSDRRLRDRQPRQIDFIRRDAENHRLGRLGEQFGLEVEKRRLIEARRHDLAKKVEWVADTIGDGLGFDILSFNETDDTERFIEVKTTGLGRYFPFYVTENEVRCSEAEPTNDRLRSALGRGCTQPPAK
jgi:hypothetical protein